MAMIDIPCSLENNNRSYGCVSCWDLQVLARRTLQENETGRDKEGKITHMYMRTIASPSG
jgi:hypothetical protein